jgi:hypothetical protein
MKSCSGGELFSPTENLFSLTYLYFSRLVPFLFIKTLLRYAIHEKCYDNFLKSLCGDLAICLESLSLNL